jgi:hypothetical protein
VGSLDLIYPINKLFRFSILDAIRLSDLLRLSRPITAQSQPHNQRSLWLKFAVSPNRSLQTPPAPKQIFDHNQLNSFALQIPAVGVWGNSKFDLSASDILSLLLSLSIPYPPVFKMHDVSISLTCSYFMAATTGFGYYCQ